MGEAKRRREAKMAGDPWPEDLPKVYPHAGQYLGDDGEWHPIGGTRRPKMSTAALLAIASLMSASKQ